MPVFLQFHIEKNEGVKIINLLIYLINLVVHFETEMGTAAIGGEGEQKKEGVDSLGFGQAVFFHLAPQGGAGQRQDAGALGQMVVGEGEHLADVLSFRFFQG
jgi:hypothetical protein